MPAIRPFRATAALALALALACHRNRVETRPPATVPLIVRNDGMFDVTVYALPSTGSTSMRIRIGLVSSASAVTLVVPKRALQLGGTLVVMLHAVGARSSWVSPSLTLPEGTAAHLDIAADPSGDVSRSSLYALPSGEP
jgi:hypothetical protein